jgi:hypothetical protein
MATSNPDFQGNYYRGKVRTPQVQALFGEYIYIYDMQYLQLPKWICFPERLGRPIREA